MKRFSGSIILRIIDANFNRSREGLRVCEDIARFALRSRIIASDLKAIRHSVSAVLEDMPSSIEIMQSRDTGQDAGRSSRSPTEMRRTGAFDIFMANMERSKESIRVLEEFSKLIDGSLSARFSKLRFRLYDIEKKVYKRASSLRNTR